MVKNKNLLEHFVSRVMDRYIAIFQAFSGLVSGACHSIALWFAILWRELGGTHFYSTEWLAQRHS